MTLSLQAAPWPLNCAQAKASHTTSPKGGHHGGVRVTSDMLYKYIFLSIMGRRCTNVYFYQLVGAGNDDIQK